MSDSKFTPGPWGINSGGEVVADINNHLWVMATNRGSDDQANAQLIAAAPDLYEALADLVHDFEGEPGFGPARAALAKAEGRS